MNLRLYSIALLISAFPNLANARATITLNRGDFLAAERVTPSGETVVKVQLSKSGKAKFKKLNRQSVNETVHAEIADVKSDFRLREPIKGAALEMGPYSSQDADRIVTVINNK